MKTAIVFLLVGVLLVGFVCAFEFRYSEPTEKDGHEIDWENPISVQPIKTQISKGEWDEIFEDYRSGKISKTEARNIIKGVEIKW